MSTAYARRRRALWTAKPRLTDGELWQSRGRCREQATCLVNEAGWRYMRSHYDRFPPAIRRRLQTSPFNLCAACVLERGGNLEVIESMERLVRRLQETSP